MPRERWDITSPSPPLIFHDRRICDAPKPNTCPSAFKAEKVGRSLRASAPAAATAKKKPG